MTPERGRISRIAQAPPSMSRLTPHLMNFLMNPLMNPLIVPPMTVLQAPPVPMALAWASSLL